MAWDSIGSAQCLIMRAVDASKVLLDAEDPLSHEKQRAIAIHLVQSLVEVKSELGAAREERSALYEEIRSLSKSFERRDAIGKHLDAYYLTDGQKRPTGDPHCLRCWEVDHFLIHLIRSSDAKSECPSCDKMYLLEATPFQLNIAS